MKGSIYPFCRPNFAPATSTGVSIMVGDKELRRSEIIRHNKKDDCWIILFNEVYDISHFIKSHPGGTEILLSRAGEDATSFFSDEAWKKTSAAKYLIQI